jgi:hypothetical protein
MAAARYDRSGLFLAAALGMTALAARPSALAQAPTVKHGNGAPHQEVVITATRETDAVLTAKVDQALQDVVNEIELRNALWD